MNGRISRVRRKKKKYFEERFNQNEATPSAGLKECSYPYITNKKKVELGRDMISPNTHIIQLLNNSTQKIKFYQYLNPSTKPYIATG